MCWQCIMSGCIAAQPRCLLGHWLWLALVLIEPHCSGGVFWYANFSLKIWGALIKLYWCAVVRARRVGPGWLPHTFLVGAVRHPTCTCSALVLSTMSRALVPRASRARRCLGRSSLRDGSDVGHTRHVCEASAVSEPIVGLLTAVAVASNACTRALSSCTLSVNMCPPRAVPQTVVCTSWCFRGHRCSAGTAAMLELSAIKPQEIRPSSRKCTTGHRS